MIKVTQTLTKADYEFASGVHYSTYRSARIRPFLSVLLTLLGLLLLATSSNNVVGAVFVLYGVLMPLRKKIWIRRIIKSAATAKGFGKDIEVEIDEDQCLATRQGDDQSTIRLENLYGFVCSPKGILLYPQRNIFYFLKSDGFETLEDMADLEKILESSGVKRL